MRVHSWKSSSLATLSHCSDEGFRRILAEADVAGEIEALAVSMNVQMMQIREGWIDV